jgi:hypothetical protein
LETDPERGVEGELKGLFLISPIGYRPPNIFIAFIPVWILMAAAIRRLRDRVQNGNVGSIPGDGAF